MLVRSDKKNVNAEHNTFFVDFYEHSGPRTSKKMSTMTKLGAFAQNIKKNHSCRINNSQEAQLSHYSATV